ncbi:DUF2247 family protein [Harryflintia acetispora]|uniref:DUF2247 family protein n=1 Tax=Harryflintia acetispora TaxID=1849041 RepID=UPI001049A007|nr:DUF2247 family protein [Harryflintia acetispora]
MKNSLDILVPYKYVASNILLTWPDIKFGIDNKYLCSDDAITHAVEEMEKKHEYNADLEELAMLFKGEEIEPYLSRLASSTSQDANETEKRWLYLLLKWIYDNKFRLYTAPLEMIEIVYADFDYPEAISNLIRYMPSDGANIGENVLFENWKLYLNTNRKLYLPL